MPCHRRFIKSRTSPLWPELLLCNTLSSRQIRKPITDSSRRLSVRTPERSGCPSEPQSIFEHEDVATRLAGQGRGASRAHREARTRGARFLASCSVPCSSALRIAAAVRGRLITVLRASTYTTRERQDISGGRVPGEPRRPRPAGLVAAAADPSNERTSASSPCSVPTAWCRTRSRAAPGGWASASCSAPRRRTFAG